MLHSVFICTFVFASNSGHFRINNFLLFLAPLFLFNFYFCKKVGGLKPSPSPFLSVRGPCLMDFVLISIETNLDGVKHVVHLAICSLKNVSQVGNEAGLMLSQVSAKCQSTKEPAFIHACGRSLSSSVVHRTYLTWAITSRKSGVHNLIVE